MKESIILLRFGESGVGGSGVGGSGVGGLGVAIFEMKWLNVIYTVPALFSSKEENDTHAASSIP